MILQYYWIICWGGQDIQSEIKSSEHTIDSREKETVFWYALIISKNKKKIKIVSDIFPTKYLFIDTF